MSIEQSSKVWNREESEIFKDLDQEIIWIYKTSDHENLEELFINYYAVKSELIKKWTTNHIMCIKQIDIQIKKIQDLNLEENIIINYLYELSGFITTNGIEKWIDIQVLVKQRTDEIIYL